MLKEKVATSQAYGNKEIVDMLEGWLETAKDGKLCHLSLVAQQFPDVVLHEFAGIPDMEYAVPMGLDLLKLKIWEREWQRTPLPVDDTLDCSYVSYNCAQLPTSYDFLPWLITAEMTRVRANAASPLKIAFTMGDTRCGVNTERRMQMLANVMIPMLSMIGAKQIQKVGRSYPILGLKPVVEACRNGETVPKLKPTQLHMNYVANALEGAAPVTITLRELDVWQHRNSNLENWKKFADELTMDGECVIFVRDTAKAAIPLDGYQTFPMASTNLHVRHALYEQAKMNFFVPNGPWNLQLFGNAPWRMFCEVSDDDPYVCNRPGFWRDAQGIEAGEQFPWQFKNQKIIWTQDSYEAIAESWSCL